MFVKFIFSFGLLKFNVLGMILYFRAREVLIRLVTPAAISVCPIFVFTEPIGQNCFLLVYFLKARVSASTSIGSPSLVAVPCAST